MGRRLFVLLVLLVLLLPAVFFALDFLRLGGQMPALPGGDMDILRARSPLNDRLVNAWGQVHTLLSGTGSPQVVRGMDGWLFFAPALDSLLGAKRMAEGDIAALADALQGLSGRLLAQGTRFVLLVAPDKGWLVADQLPTRIRPAPWEQTDLARLLAHLARRGVPAPDLMAALAATELPSYLKTDTHWSAYGAYLAFEALWQAAGMEAPLALSARDFTVETPFPGDLVPLYLPLEKDSQTDLLPVLPRAYRSARPLRSVDDLDIQTTSPTGPALFVARDSFGRALFPYLANAAGRLRFVRGYEGFEEKAAGYDLAVLVIAQRSLSGLLAVLAPP